MTEDKFNLIAAQLEDAKQHHMRILNAALFSDDGRPRRHYPPTPVWKKAWWRVRGYLSTLWDALRGRDPFEPGDY